MSQQPNNLQQLPKSKKRVSCLNVCPHCRTPMKIDFGDFPPWSGTRVAACGACGHLVAIEYPRAGLFAVATIDYAWLHRPEITPEMLEHVREIQEEVHRAAGHWG